MRATILAGIAALTAAPLMAAEPDGKPTVVPSVLRSVAPRGVVRGAAAMFTLDGARLEGATAAFFDDPAIHGQVLPAADPKKADQVRVRAEVGSEARIGVHHMIVRTPRGTTGAVPFAVGGWPEIREAEPDDTPRTAQPISLPATVVGTLEKPGDVDCFRFEARAGQEVVFQIIGAAIRSRLNAVLALTDAAGRVVTEANAAGSRPEPLIGWRITTAGSYCIQVRDFENAGGEDVYYRLNIGEFPVVTAVSPLGLRRGTTAPILLTGFNLGPQPGAVPATRSDPRAPAPQAVNDLPAAGMDRERPFDCGNGFADPAGFSRLSLGPGTRVAGEGRLRPGNRAVRVTAPATVSSSSQTMPLPGDWLSAPRLAVGEDREVAEAEPNNDPGHAQRVTAPITINGRIYGTSGPPDADLFRFTARRGQRLVLEVTARRLGSPLDSLIEVLDARGRPVERATIRPVAETSLVLSGRDSSSGGFRVQSWTDFALNDYVFAGRELLQITHLPQGPDEDVGFRTVRGSRLGLLDTTPEAHSIGASVYKVQVHAPGRTLAPNGMPLFHLFYRNDDGGAYYGKDSRMTFDPPAEGDYIVRISDVRGQGGPEFAYRLAIHPPRPDFRLSFSPEHPNLLRGSSVPVSVGIERFDGFDGPVDVRLEGLPAGFSATSGVIAPGAESVTLTLAATAGAASPAVVIPSPVRVVGQAVIGGRQVVRTVDPENGLRLLTVLPLPDIHVATDVQRVSLSPGGSVEVEAQVERRNGFKGRVPIEVLNLPYGVQVRDVGLNGVLITEQQTRRRFIITAEPWVKPQTRLFFAVGRVESDPSTEIASEPITLTVAPGAARASR